MKHEDACKVFVSRCFIYININFNLHFQLIVDLTLPWWQQHSSEVRWDEIENSQFSDIIEN